MDYKILLAFSIGMIILAVSPGPGVLASVSTAVSKGFKASLVFITGLVVGDIFFFTLALLGMSAISKVMGQLFYMIKFVGGIYHRKVNFTSGAIMISAGSYIMLKKG